MPSHKQKHLRKVSKVIMKPSRRELELLKEHFDGDELKAAIERFESGEPLAYVIGEWYFYGLTFKVDENCLIPRADTEHVVEKAIELLPKSGRFADLCTGSGCIAISVVKNRADTQAFACDISHGALKMAKKNAVLNGVRNSGIDFKEADVFSLELPENAFDVIISNPPYIRTSVIPTLNTVRYEPKAALDGGEDGMVFYRHIVKKFACALKDNGAFVFEIGYDQRSDIENIANELGFCCEVTRDYGGNDRVAVLRKHRGL